MTESAHSALTGANLHNVKQHNHDADTEAGGGKLSGAVVDSFVEFEPVSAPSTPASGKLRVYNKTGTDELYQVDDGGTETSLATGGGGGGGGAPDTADYWVETTNGSLSAEVVVGTTGIHTAAYASRNAAAKAGRLFLPNNSFYIERDTGSVWASWGPINQLTPPIDGDYTWTNQGGATVTTTNGGVHLAIASGATGQSLRIRKKNAPSTPYTITALVRALSVTAGGASEVHFGIGFRQASDGKCHTLTMDPFSTATRLWSTKWTSATVFSAQYTTIATNAILEGLCWFRIADNGTNRILSISTDGINFAVFHTIGRTDFLTADEVMFYVSGSNAAAGMALTLLSWKEA